MYLMERIQKSGSAASDSEWSTPAAHFVDALPWVVHSLQNKTGAAELPKSCLQYLVQSCVALLAASAAACNSLPGAD